MLTAVHSKGTRIYLEFIYLEGVIAGIPEVYWYGKQEGYNFMVFEHLGANLEQLWKKGGKNFTVKTVLLLADHMV